MISIPESVFERFRAFSLYNSPYRAHDAGCAIDLYPGPDRSSPASNAPSPVAGEVIAIERVRAPPKPYAPNDDFVIAIDTAGAEAGSVPETPDGTAAIARILHVDPTVAVGDHVTIGERLGTPIRAGFFAPWVGHHLHLGFRRPVDDILRAAGSVPITPETDVEPVRWDGTGTVVETGETYAVVDRPEHPAPEEGFAGIAASVESRDGDAETVALDGGLPHYDRGGCLPNCELPSGATVSLLGATIGVASDRGIDWHEPTVTVDGTPIEGLSLAAVRSGLGAKLICPELSLSEGQQVRVDVQS